MSKKFRLFASVAAPFVSLPLMMQPAGAAPLRPALETGNVSGVINVQQQIIVPQGAEGAEPQGQQPGEGKQRPHRQQGQGQGSAEGQGEPGGQQQRPPKAAQAPDAQQPEQQPRHQRPAEPEAAPQQASPRQAPQAEQPGAEAPVKPQRQQQTDQNAQPRPSKQQQAAPDAEKPAAKGAQQEPAPEGSGNKPRGNAQSDKPAAAPSQAEAPAAPKPAQADKAQTAPAKPAAPAQADQAQPTPAKPPVPAQADQAQPAPAKRVAPAQADQAQPTPAAPSQAPQPAQRSTVNGQAQPAPAGQQPQGLAAQPAQQPSAQQPAAQQPVAPQPAGQQAQQPAPPPSTPQQVERAKQLAKDPNSAKSGEQVVLPVQNGAAVLDSAKEAPATPGAGQPPRRQPQQADQRPMAPPKSDADAQSNTRISRDQQTEFRQLTEERGQRLDRRPEFDRPGGWDLQGPAGRQGNGDRNNGRIIISIDNQQVVRHDDSRRFYQDGGRQPEYERLGDDRVREVIERDDGTRVVTIRNRYGEIVQRTRIVKGGQQYVLYEAPELMDDSRRGRNYVWRDPGDDLPPMRLSVPVDRYIIDTSSEPDRDYYEFLEQPPVETVERVYSLDEVRYSARIRDKVPRIDLDTITFATGSADIPMNQASSLRKVADAINKVLKKDPSESFLIEGHTDAVGADQDNLVLSDERAESVAKVLTDAFGIPPENLATQGYGERYLKVRTDGPEQQNRRVTIRRITSLVKPVASNR